MGTLVFQATLGGSVNLIGPNTASTINFTLPSADGTNGQALTTNGSGVLAFTSVTTAPGGSTTQVQYNNAGVFAGSSNLTFNGTTLTAAGLSGPHNGTVGATTPATGAFTTVTATSTVTAPTAFYLINDVERKHGVVLTTGSPNGFTDIYGAGLSGTWTGSIRFYTSNNAAAALRMSIYSTGEIKTSSTISVGDANPSSSGAGITFPATQSASSDANTLDDYEEGTWTPTQGAGLTVVGTFSSTGRYTKIGRTVTVSGNVIGSTSIAVSASSIMCGGLPFNDGAYGLSVGTMVNSATNAGGFVNVYITDVYVATTIGATSSIIFSVTYTV